MFTDEWKATRSYERLDKALVQELALLGHGLNVSEVRSVLKSGNFYINEKRATTSSRPLRVGDQCQIYFKQIQPLKVLFEDDVLIILNKPSGLPSTATTTDRFQNAFEIAKAQFKGSTNYLAIHNRLDRETSGGLVFCKKKSQNKWVSDLFENRKISKTYMLICMGKLNWKKTTVNDPIGPTPSKEHLMKFGICATGRPSKTLFKVLTSHKDHHLIEAIPITGRTHQIRVHLSKLGLSIIGDPIYGEPNKSNKMALHCLRYEFENQQGIAQSVVAPLELDFIDLMSQFGISI